MSAADAGSAGAAQGAFTGPFQDPDRHSSGTSSRDPGGIAAVIHANQAMSVSRSPRNPVTAARPHPGHAAPKC
jgi:hypothetical protein